MKFPRKLVAAAILAASPQIALSQDVSLTLITQPPGTSWYSFGSTFADVISASEGDHNLSVEALPRGGGMANPVVVNQRAADIGFANSNAAVWARDGVGEEFEGRESTGIRAITGGLQISPTTVLARRSYVERTGHTTFAEILAADDLPRIVMKPTGSQVPLIADFLFQAEGTSLEELRSRGAIIQVETAQISQMLRDGTADVYIENAPVGQATMTEVTLTTDMVLLPYSDATLDYMVPLGLPRAFMAEGSYEGQGEDYENPMSSTILIVHEDMDEEIAYQITRALVEGRDVITNSYPALAEWDPEAGAQIEQTALELHAGAARYYREQGWIE